MTIVFEMFSNKPLIFNLKNIILKIMYNKENVTKLKGNNIILNKWAINKKIKKKIPFYLITACWLVV